MEAGPTLEMAAPLALILRRRILSYSTMAAASAELGSSAAPAPIPAASGRSTIGPMITHLILSSGDV
jgi:hypothetical protein